MSTPGSNKQGQQPAAATTEKFVINLFGGPDDVPGEESEPMSYLEEEQEHEMTEEQLAEEAQQQLEAEVQQYTGQDEMMQSGDEEQQAQIVIEYSGEAEDQRSERQDGGSSAHLSVAKPQTADDRKISIQLFENSQDQEEQEPDRKISIQLFDDEHQSESQNNNGIEKSVEIQKKSDQNQNIIIDQIKSEMNNFKFETDQQQSPKDQQQNEMGGGETMIKLDFGDDDLPPEDSQMDNQSDNLGESFENEQHEMQEDEDLAYPQEPDALGQNDGGEVAQAHLQANMMQPQPNEAMNNSGILDFTDSLDQLMVEQHNMNANVQIDSSPAADRAAPIKIQLDAGDEEMMKTQQNAINQYEYQPNRITIPNEQEVHQQMTSTMVNLRDSQQPVDAAAAQHNFGPVDVNNPLGEQQQFPDNQEIITEAGAPKAKANRSQAHSSGKTEIVNISEFYNLRKIKYTLEFESPLQKKTLKRSQFIYTFEPKDENQIAEKIQRCKTNEQKKMYIDFGMHLKQMRITEVSFIEKTEQGGYKKGAQIQMPKQSDTYGAVPSLNRQANKEDGVPGLPMPEKSKVSDDVTKQAKKKSWYLNPDAQAKHFHNVIETGKISKDLQTLDHLQRELRNYSPSDDSDMQVKKPEFHIHKFITINIGKNEVRTSDGRRHNDITDYFKKELKIMVTLAEPTSLTDFGIRAIDYKPEDSLAETHHGKLNTYFITSDAHEASQLWIPQIYGMNRDPIGWSMRYIVPPGAQVVSSGNFVNKKDMAQDKTLFIFKSKDRTMIADKIGFIIGEFPYISNFDQGAALFTSNQKLQLFNAKNFYSNQIKEVIEYIQEIINMQHPASLAQNPCHLKLIFVPNLFLRKQLKQSVSYASCIHVFDQDVLLPRNIIEKRHKIYKILATCLSFDYFGNQVWAETEQDIWLLTSIRERIGDRYKRAKCGQAFYRYSICKTTKKFCKKVKQNAERYSLSSQYVSHFSEIEYGEDLYYQKCQLVMHMVEQMLGETHFQRVTRDLFKKSNPTMNQKLFKKLLKDIGIKFDEIQQNWINSTSCPQIECAFTYNKKNNSVDITLEQHSILKHQFMLESYLKEGGRLRKENENYYRGERSQMYAKGQIESDDMHAFVEDVCHDGQEVKKSLHKLRQQEDLDQKKSFNVEKTRQCMRWFTGDIKVVIYQTDGADITAQTQKLKLKKPKTKVQCNVPLKYKVRRAINNKRRADNMLMMDFNDQGRDEEKPKESGNPGQVDKILSSKNSRNTAERDIISMAEVERRWQLLKDNNEWRFGMADDEWEEYPEIQKRKTKSLFDVKNIDSNTTLPILWVRVDPEYEYIRKVKVHQTMENWLFQLLQEKDPMGQIEACKALRNYNDEDVYEILMAVAKNERLFFKVRKQALRSLEKIQVSVFQEYLPHERAFLINYYNSRNFDDEIGFYKSNNFADVLEYYINTYLLRSLAKSKEQKLSVNRLEIRKSKQKAIDAVKRIKEDVEEIINETKLDAFNKTGLPGSQGRHNNNPNFSKQNDKAQEEAKKDDDEIHIDMRDYSLTTDLISTLMMKLLHENDNSENAFDDCFLIGKILSNLGKLDHFECMPLIAKEMQRQFNFDHIGKFSAQYAVSKGAIKGYYNMRKQIYRYQQFKKPYIDEQKQQHESDEADGKIKETEEILNEIKQTLERIMDDASWPLELRAFIFEKKVKNDLMYGKSGELAKQELLRINAAGMAATEVTEVIPDTKISKWFLNPLYHLIRQIESSFKADRFQFGVIQLSILAKFLEENFQKKLNFKELLMKQNDQRSKIIGNMLWYIMAEAPMTNMDGQASYWTKRIYNTIFFGSGVPYAFAHEQQLRGILPTNFENVSGGLDEAWRQSEIQQQQDAAEQDIQGAQHFTQDDQQQVQPEAANVLQQNFGENWALLQQQNQLNNISLQAQYQQQLLQAQLGAALPVPANFPTGIGMMVDPNAAVDQANFLPDSVQLHKLNTYTQDMAAKVKDQKTLSMLNQAELKGPLPPLQVNSFQVGGAASNVIKIDVDGDLLGSHQQPMQGNPYPFDQANQQMQPTFDQNHMHTHDPSATNNNIINLSLVDEDPQKAAKKDKKKKKKAKKQHREAQDEEILPDEYEEQEYQAKDDQYQYQDQQYNPNLEDAEVAEPEEEDDNYVVDQDLDDFPDYTFPIEWQQNCWLILYHLYFHEDSRAFLQDISEEAMGSQMFEDYLRTIEPNLPMNFMVVKKKMTAGLYSTPPDFINDVNLVFNNCMKFNEKRSGLYKAAKKLKNEFAQLLAGKGLNEL